jgi:hypothetical protein
MDAKDRLIQELTAQLESKEAHLSRTLAKLEEVTSLHVSVTEQFQQQLEDKSQQISLLERKIRRLLSTVRGSRQERINPNQLLLFTPEELQQLMEDWSHRLMMKPLLKDRPWRSR